MAMQNEGQEILPIQELVLQLPPSCVEFCPAHPDLFVVGTYNLVAEESEDWKENESSRAQGSQSRNGSLVAFSVNGNSL